MTAGVMNLRVPIRRAEESHDAVVLAIDESGSATWHFARDTSGPAAAGAIEATAGSRVLEFEIPYRAWGAELGPRPEFAGLPGAIGRKLLKVLFFKAADVAVGQVGKWLVSKWEEKNRPTRLRWFTPDNYRTAGAGTIKNPQELSALQGRPGKAVLLFLHGAFSTSHGGFGGLPPTTMSALHDAYEHRVLAFDHATLASGPVDNLDRLLTILPPNPGLTFDVISHSRGGLVARGLAGEFATPPPGVTVRRAVMVAAPNHGTPLADIDHIGGLLDRMTTALMLIPPLEPMSLVTETLETVISAVKFVGHGVASRLSGLMAMNPTGEFIRQLNRSPAPPSTYFAMAADYEPHQAGLVGLIRAHLDDATVDWVFGQAPNDLVVPELGVSEGPAPDDPVFPIPAVNLERFGTDTGIWHCSYFGAKATSDRLVQWLLG